MIDETAMDRLLREHFATRANPTVIDGQADRALARVAVQRQRPAWLAAIRGSSVGVARRLEPDRGGRRVAMVLALGLLVLIAIVLAIVGAQRHASPFGNGLLAITRDGDILLVDPATGDERRVVEDVGLTFQDPTWSPGGRYLLFREQNGASYVLDVGTGEVRRLGILGPAKWSWDGSRLAALEEATLRVIDPATGTRRDLIGAGAEAAPQPLDWSPDGRWLLAGGSDRDLLRIDVASGDSMVLLPSSQSSSAFDARWSPDGTRIVLITPRPCPGGDDVDFCPRALATIRADGTELANLADAAVSDAAWSPDGRWIAYTSMPLTELVSADQLSGRSVFGVSIVAADGSSHRQVAERVTQWAWSPDGASLVYSSIDSFEQQQSAPTRRYDLATGDHRDLGIASEGFAWQPIRSSEAAPTLPSGPFVASGPSDVSRPPVTPAPGPDADPSGSASGIGFNTECEVLSYAFGASEPRLVAAVPGCPPASSSTATWASDGSAIIVTIDETATVIARDGTTLAELSAADTHYSWSPGGTFMLQQQCGGIDCGMTPTILRPDGSGRTPIPGYPWWSADDSRLAVIDSDGRLSLGSGDGSDLTATDIRADVGPVSWAPDGSRLAFVRDGNAWIAAVDGTEEQQLTEFALGGVSNVAWSPDGRWVAMVRGTSLWIAATDGSREVRRMPVPDAYRYYDVAWAPNGDRLATAGLPDRQLNTPAGWERTFIVSLDDEIATELSSASDPAWSPDGRFLAVLNTANERLQIDVLNADGSGRHPIPTGRFAPAWSKAWLP